MKAYREDMQVRERHRGTSAEQRRAYAAVIGSVVLIAAVLTFLGLRDSADAIEEAPFAGIPANTRVDSMDAAVAVAMPVAAEAPLAVEPQTTAIASVAAANFGARELAPLRQVVGIGKAPVVLRDSDSRLIINGELLEKLEADAPPRPVID